VFIEVFRAMFRVILIPLLRSVFGVLSRAVFRAIF